MRELHTERLLLRTPRERDAAEIMAIRNSAFVMKNNVMEVFDKEQMVHLIHREIDYENKKNRRTFCEVIPKKPPPSRGTAGAKLERIFV